MDVSKLLALPLSELRDRFLTRDQAVPEGLLGALESDPRRGAQGLAGQIQRKKAGNRAEGQRLRQLLKHERELWEQGIEHVAGCDEAGIGPLAGPVVAGAVILPHDFRPRGIDDSKKLDHAEHEALEAEIKRDAIAWAIGVCSVEEVDRHNVFRAGLLAMRRAVDGLDVVPGHILVDGKNQKVPESRIPQRSIIGGDALSISIAAASILAKVHRDRLMDALAKVHPGYGFETHKGYATPEHQAALKSLGACPAHRRSFAPVREALGLTPLQAELFPARPGTADRAR